MALIKKNKRTPVENNYLDAFAQALEVQAQARRASLLGIPFDPSPFGSSIGNLANTVTPSNERTLTLIKKSIKQIETEAVDEKARGRIENKILRLLELGVTAQATILETELEIRQKLNHLKEWDYKILPHEEIGRFESEHRMTATRDGLRIHIDPLEAYCGDSQNGEAKDRIIPNAVLNKLEEAKERKLFDTFSVLWVERVKDPLLLGSISGCEDYFLIAEWGEDVSFDQIMKE